MKHFTFRGRRAWTCALTAAVGCLVVILCWYPGYMWWDSANQFNQARYGHYTDWHPPLMSYVWSRFHRIGVFNVVPGPFPMLVLHNLMFWGGLGLLVHLTRLPVVLAPIAILAIGLFPPIFVALGIVLKDAGLIAALLLAYAGLCWAYLRGSRVGLVVGLGGLMYACAIRYNAAPALAPLSVLAGFAAVRAWPAPLGRPRLAGAAVADAILVGFPLIAWQGGRMLTEGRTLHPSQQVPLHDLLAVSVATERIQLPAYILEQAPGLTLADLRRLYSTESLGRMFWRSAPPRFSELISDENYRELLALWRATIPANLEPYIRHRLEMFRHLFGIGPATVCDPYLTGPIEDWPNVLGFSPVGRTFNASVVARLGPIRNDILFRGWFYLALNAALLAWLLARPGPRLAVGVLGLSGLGYALAYLPLATACHFRLLWWTVLVPLLLPIAALLPAPSPAAATRPAPAAPGTPRPGSSGAPGSPAGPAASAAAR
jgi:hypothetical protein